MRQKPALTAADAHKMILPPASPKRRRTNGTSPSRSVDDSGAVILLERLDGCGAISSEVAIGKARTSALTKRPTKFFEDRVKERPGFVTFSDAGA